MNGNAILMLVMIVAVVLGAVAVGPARRRLTRAAWDAAGWKSLVYVALASALFFMAGTFLGRN